MSELDRYSNIESELIIGSGKRNVCFSIVIPTYNRSVFLKYALESAIHQNYKGDYEILVLENGLSVDDSSCEELILKYNDKRVNYYRNAENIGMHGNWNRACLLASGEYIIMLHDDDMLSPDFMTVITKLVSLYPDALISGGVSYFNSDGAYSFDVEAEAFNSVKLYKYNENDLFHLNFVGVTGSLFSKKLFLEYGGFREDLFPCADYDFAVWMGKNYNEYLTKKILFAYRCFDNASSSGDVLQKMTEKSVQIVEKDLCDSRARSFAWKFFKRTRIIRRILIDEKQWKVLLDRDSIFKDCGLSPYKAGEERSLRYFFMMNMYRLSWWWAFIKHNVGIKNVRVDNR